MWSIFHIYHQKYELDLLFSWLTFPFCVSHLLDSSILNSLIYPLVTNSLLVLYVRFFLVILLICLYYSFCPFCSISLCISSSVFLCLCICMSLASGCSRRLVVWFFSKHQHALTGWAQTCFSSAPQMKRLLIFFILKNDSLSPHAQFQSRADLIGAFGSTPTVNVLSGNLRHCAFKHLARYFWVIWGNLFYQNTERPPWSYTSSWWTFLTVSMLSLNET